MKKHTRRMLALLLAVLLLGLCACSAKVAPAQEQKPEQTIAAEPVQAEQPQEAALAEETPETPEKEAQTPQEPPAEEALPEETAPEASAEQAAEPEVRAPMDEQPVQEQPAAQDAPLTCTISISCATILSNTDELDPEKLELVPEDGWILAPVTVAFTAGQSVFDVLLATVKEQAIHMEYQNTPMYETAYIEGIGNLYEFDCGALSGWMYRVNGWFPNYGCSRYAVQAGDVIEWMYTCDLGSDVGGSGVSQGYDE